MSKGYTAQYVRTLVRKHKAPLKKRIKELEARLEKYDELIMEVACKFPNETRHETARRYLHERENREIAGPSQDEALGEQE